MPTRAQISKVEEQRGGHTDLMRAALTGDLDTVRSLIAGGADVNERNADGRTPLMFAAINRETSCAKELLENGADVNAKANDGGTALMFAASEGAFGPRAPVPPASRCDRLPETRAPDSRTS